ncbi:MAG: hypothetical protein ABIF18_01630 [archaeon]
MFFRKKKGMIDVRELQRRGVVRIPKNDIVIPTDRDGFVEIGGSQKSTNSNTEFFGFTNTTSPVASTLSENSFSPESDGYNKREVDEKITELDNKIYKLENRIELLEKKLNINQSSDASVGVMGW